MHVFHDIGPDDCVQICFHEVEDQINIFVVFGFQDV